MAKSLNSQEPTPEEAQRLINDYADFVYLKRFDYSLRKLLKRYPDGVPDKVIAQALMIPEEYLPQLWDDVISRLRNKVKSDL